MKTDVTNWSSLSDRHINGINNSEEVKVPKRSSFVRKKFNDGPPKGTERNETKYNIVSGI